MLKVTSFILQKDIHLVIYYNRLYFRNFLFDTIFASSLLSLISPWDRSRAARSPRSRTRCPRQVAPPPPPRRHSAPLAPPNTPETLYNPKCRRHSQTEAQSKLDLRQELLNTNVDFGSWLGNRYEVDNRERDIFEHDIPLQRSLSVDRGKDAFVYLHSLGSNWSGSFGTVSDDDFNDDGDGESQSAEDDKSFEDVPASQYRLRSRRASSALEACFIRNMGLMVLKDSYKGIEVDSVLNSKWNFSSSTISNKEEEDNEDECAYERRKLQKNPIYWSTSGVSIKSNDSILEMSINNKLMSDIDKKKTKISFKESTVNNISNFKKSDKSVNIVDIKSDSSRSLLRNKSVQFETENIRSDIDTGTDIKGRSLPTLIRHVKKIYKSSTDILKSEAPNPEDGTQRKLIPFYRSISVATSKIYPEKSASEYACEKSIGMMRRNMSYQGLKKPDNSLRKEVLKQSLYYKSCEDVSASKAYRDSAGPNAVTQAFLTFKNSYKVAFQEKRNENSKIDLLTDKASKIEIAVRKSADVTVVTEKESIPKYVNASPVSGLVGGTCNCQICMEEETLEIQREPSIFHVDISNENPLANDLEPLRYVDANVAENVAKHKTVSPTSGLVEMGSSCNCQICMEEERFENERQPSMFYVLSKCFIKIVCSNGKKLAYRDDNKLSESEMYTCFMHILKMMFGLWLRHLDHN
ncbi:hypothetical protein ACJJTC_001554 [Scirpophaga incertulas]